MGRALRFDPADGRHHVMNRGVDHGRVFFTADDGRRFLGLLADAAARDGVDVLAYCLMPNHFHLLLRCPTGGLSAFMHRVTASYARGLNERLERDGPVFRGRFRSLPVTSEDYLRNAGRYIHRNPVDLRPPVELAAYRWSSYRHYVGRVPAPEWLHCRELLEADGGVERHRAFVEHDRPAAGPDAIRWAIDTALAEAPEPGIRPEVLRTALAVRVSDSIGPNASGALEADLAFPSEAARRMALRRARCRLDENSQFASLVSRVMSLAWAS